MADRTAVPENSHLRRFWFPLPGHIGIGVTAFSRSEAEALAQSAAREMGWTYSSGAVVEDIDIRDLDQKHVLPNMGLVNFRGVWFPALNHNGAK
jgi:hypothetical protein